jgi:hypothetical protein
VGLELAPATAQIETQREIMSRSTWCTRYSLKPPERRILSRKSLRISRSTLAARGALEERGAVVNTLSSSSSAPERRGKR